MRKLWNMKKTFAVLDFTHEVLKTSQTIAYLNDFANKNALPITWMIDQTAAILEFADSQSALMSELENKLRVLHVDINYLPAFPSKKRLFLADMDSTMIEQECIDELADRVGLKEKVSHITERAMRGEIAFEPALRERVALLKGLPITVVDELITHKITLMQGAKTAITTMKAHGTYTCLVSGGFTVFTSKIAAMLGFDEHRANTLVVENGYLTGEVLEPILGQEAKRQTLIELRGKLNLEPHDTMAVGDGANDLAMLQEAGLGIAFRAKPAVAAAAHTRITFGDLTGLLHLQGYMKSV